MAKPRFLSLDGVRILVSYFKNQLSGKVDKVDGKSLSDNNFSDEEKAKLAGIEADSQVNVIESISVNGTDQVISNKNVDLEIGWDDVQDKPNVAAGTGNDAVVVCSLEQNVASAVYAYAEGVGTTASGQGSHAEGAFSTASGDVSHAEGRLTIASGIFSHSEGWATTAHGRNSHAEGYYTLALGESSHTEGYKTAACGYCEHVFGKYNIATSVQSDVASDYVEIVGNGTADARSNARTLDWNGNEVLSGKLTVGAAPANDMDVTTKSYVDTELAKKQDTINFTTPTSSDVGKALMPKTIENGEVTEWEFGEAGMVDDVQINGTSIVANKVANIPMASNSKFGVVKINASNYGIGINQSDGCLYIGGATENAIKEGTATYRTIFPSRQHLSTFYGLAKAAGDTTQSQSDNAIGTYTDEAKTAIQSMLGIDTAIANAVSDITSFEFSVVQELPAIGEKGIIYLVAHSHDTNDGYDEYIWVNNNAFEKLGNTDINLTDYVRNTDYATNTTAGVVKIDSSYGLSIWGGNNAGVVAVNIATTNELKAGNATYKLVGAANNHTAAFYGLAKASGDTTQSQSNNAVGVYTDEAKIAIKNMLGVEDPVDVQINGTSIINNGVANIPLANTSGTLGVVNASASNGIGVNAQGTLYVSRASDTQIKAGTVGYKPIVPESQHMAAFYGLAKASGDTTQSQSDNAVGTYTDEAKASIQSMLGVPSIDDIPQVPVQDVQINDVSILGQNGIANIPVAGTSTFGVIKMTTGRGIELNTQNQLQIVGADVATIKAGTDLRRPITPNNVHTSVFYGLTKAAGIDMSNSNNAIGTYTDEAKVAIKNMIGINVDDVQVNGTSVVTNGVAEIPLASTDVAGVVKYGTWGIVPHTENGITRLSVDIARSSDIKKGSLIWKTISTYFQHESVFYGLAKAAGHDENNSTESFGTYTDEAKGAIQHMIGTDNLAPYESDITADQAYAIGELFMLNGKLHRATAAISALDVFTVGTNCEVVNASDVFTRDVQVNGTSVVTDGVAELAIAGNDQLGLVKRLSLYGIDIDSNGVIRTSVATDALIKKDYNSASPSEQTQIVYKPITPYRQHQAVFYGLAKAAGDTTQSKSSNAVGTYTDEAKTAIKQMLGIPVSIVNVSGMTPTITAESNTRYICGEVTNIDITPCSSGTCDIVFTSGSTITVLTLPQTVIMPEWFEIEANYTYEISIADGVYGVVMAWPVVA